MRNVLLGFLLAFTGGAGAEETLNGRVEKYLRPIDFRGVILIARGEKPVVERTYGMADYELEKPLAADAKFRIASITKTFTGAAIVMLAESGKLSLDDKLSKYAPSFPKADQITLRHLLDRDGALLLRWEGSTDARYVFATGTASAYNRQDSAVMTLEGDVMKVSFRGGDPLEFKRVK